VAEIVLETEELTVLGGPAQVSVDIGVGAAGRRGVFIFASAAEPDTDGQLPSSSFYTDPVINDLYICINPASDNYLVMFQLTNQDAVLRWIEVIKLTQNLYNTVRNVEFINGVGEAQVNIFNLGFGKNIPTPPLAGSSQLFGVQATAVNDSPVAISIEIKDLKTIAVDDEEVPGGRITFLPIEIYAAELNSSNVWQRISRDMIVELSLSLKDASDIDAPLFIVEES